MLYRSRIWRSASNILGTLFSFLVLVAIVASVYFFIEGNRTIAYSLFFPALGVNYFIALILSLEMINSRSREDLFINFCLFIFLILPAVGIFLYFLMGFDSLHKDNRDIYTPISNRYKRYECGCDSDCLNSVIGNFKSFSYNFLKHKVNIYRNTRVEVLDNAYTLLQEITSVIEKAKRYIHLEFYMFSDGLVFDHLVQLLGKKVKEGVEVRLIADFVGNFWRLRKRSIRRMQELGIQVRVFNKFFRFSHVWWQFRNHNKIIVVDNECAICGSCNIADEYFNITKKYFQTTELSVKLTGDIVGAVSSLFLSHWDLCNGKKRLDELEFDDQKCQIYFQRDVKPQEDSNFAQIIDNTPIGKGFIIRDNLMQLIFGATKSITISTPYFYPPKELVNALKLVKSEGINVKILVPKNPDLTGFFSTLNRQLFETLMEYGIEIYEYFGFNHEKVMIIDDEVVYFGSYNWDYRTLYLNFEHAILMKCEKLNKTIGQFMEKQLKNSHLITKSDLKKSKHYWAYAVFIKLFKPFL